MIAIDNEAPSRSTPGLNLEAEEETCGNIGPKAARAASVLQLLVRWDRYSKESGQVCLGQALRLPRSAQTGSHFLDGLGYVRRLLLAWKHRGSKSTPRGFAQHENSKCICYESMGQSTQWLHVLVSVYRSEGLVKMKQTFKKIALISAMVLVTLGATGCATTTTAVTQKWTWNTPYKMGPADAGGGSSSKNTMVLSAPSPTATKGQMKIVGYVTESCMAGGVDVLIERTADAVILLPGKLYPTCPDVRVTIRNDGKGGTVEFRAYRSKSWVVDRAEEGYDYGLLPV